MSSQFRNGANDPGAVTSRTLDLHTLTASKGHLMFRAQLLVPFLVLLCADDARAVSQTTAISLRSQP